MNFIDSVIASSAISTALVAFLALVARTWISERLKSSIKHEYDQRLEAHKAELKASNDIQLERYKSELMVASKENEIRFSNLHERQADAIAEIYSRLVQFHWDLDEYVKIYEEIGEESRDERSKKAVNSHHDFIEYFLKNQIYLSKKSVELLNDINTDCKLVFLRFKNEVHQAPQSMVTADVRIELENAVKKSIPVGLRDLEEEFRKIVGNKS